MTVIDVQALLAPVSDEQPCGEPMEDSQAYFALDNAAQFKEAGALGGEASDPDWADVKREALALTAETKDVRVAIHLTAALLRTDGWEGFAEGMQLIHGYLDQYWDDVYPRLEDDDPFYRVNALFNLSDTQRFINALRRTPVVSSRMAGAFALRDQQAAVGQRRPSEADDESDDMQVEEGSVDPNLIRAAFAEADPAQLDTTGAHVDGAIEALAGIEKTCNDHLGADAPDLSAVTRVLRQIKDWVERERRVLRGEPAEEGSEDGGGVGGPAGTINTPEQAIQALEMVADYFRRREPSSPVPLLLDRAKRLVRQDFMALMRDLAPDGVSQAQQIFGMDDEQ